MNRTQLLAAVALGVAVSAGAAQAQSGAIAEMQREQANPNRPWVPAQRRAAAEADAMGRQDVGRWLADADQALRRGRVGEANELLERAETRMLPRSSYASGVSGPVQDPMVSDITAARQALMRHDRGGAMQALASARNALGQGSSDMSTGANGYRMPMEGGPGMASRPGMYPGAQPMPAPVAPRPAPAARPLRGAPPTSNLTP